MLTRINFQLLFFTIILGSFWVCSSFAEQAIPDAKEPELTPERAKAALLQMMRSKAGQDFGWFKGELPDKIQEMKIEEQKEGWYAWTGAFCFNPSKAIYTFVVRPRPGAKARTFEYEGAFEWKDRKWSATIPKIVRSALDSGK